MLMRGILGGKAPRAEVESLRSRGYWSDFLSRGETRKLEGTFVIELPVIYDISTSEKL